MKTDFCLCPKCVQTATKPVYYCDTFIGSKKALESMRLYYELTTEQANLMAYFQIPGAEDLKMATLLVRRKVGELFDVFTALDSKELKLEKEESERKAAEERKSKAATRRGAKAKDAGANGLRGKGDRKTAGHGRSNPKAAKG